MNKKLLIGLGCSWTEGEGGVPDYHYVMNLRLKGKDTDAVKKIENENSWVNVLAQDYIGNCDSINLGSRGNGNRAAARYLYLNNANLQSYEKVIVIFMLSGLERFDVIDPYPSPEHNPVKFFTLWPNNTTKTYRWYLKNLYSEKAAYWETFFNILEVQTFCKAHNLEFVFCNSFVKDLKLDYKKYIKKQIDLVNWDRLINHDIGYTSFLDKIIKEDNKCPEELWYEYYTALKNPTKYLTPCIHPTIEGYRLIASEIYNWLNYKKIL